MIGEAPDIKPFPANGFALELHLDTAQTLVDTNTALSLTQAGLFLGVHTPSITAGVGIDLARIASSTDNGGMSTSKSSTSLLLSPGVRFVLAHADDGRVELLGVADLGIGAIWASSDSASDVPAVRHFRLQAAPGLRYWLSPAFAVGGAAGLRFDRLSQSVDQPAGSGSIDNVTSTFALFGSLQLTGVF